MGHRVTQSDSPVHIDQDLKQMFACTTVEQLEAFVSAEIESGNEDKLLLMMAKALWAMAKR